MIQSHVIVYGLVQGVFFRANTKQKADEFGIKGWVKNKEDGTVEAVLFGEEEKVNKMLAWMEKGPPEARVEKLKKRKMELEEFNSFKLRF